MRLAYRCFCFLFLVPLLLLFFAPRSARADEEATAEGAILLLVHGDDLPHERLRDAIANELHTPVALSGSGVAANKGVVTVTYRQAAHELAVTWDGPKHGTVSRVVSAPNKIDDVVRDAAMLAGNLARDEADDLLQKPSPAPPAPPLATSVEPLPALPGDDHAAAAPPATATATATTDHRKDHEELTLGFIYPLSTNYDRPYVSTHFDVNLGYGHVGELNGFQLGVVSVVAPSRGKGSGNVSGIELAMLSNIALGKVEGFQLSAVNIAGQGLEGWQTAWALNRSGGDASGVQASFGLNSTAGTMTGLQLASINVAGDVKGVQFGFINVAKNVSGTTIGIINVADDVEGVPIGIASVTKSGGVHPEAWVSNGTLGNLGLKLATKYTYTMPSAAFHHAYNRDFVGAGFTIGGHIPINEDSHHHVGAYVETDLSLTWLYAPNRSVIMLADGKPDTYHENLLQPRLRGIFGYRFAEHFGLFAGTGLLTQVRILQDGKDSIIRLGPEFVVGVEL